MFSVDQSEGVGRAGLLSAVCRESLFLTLVISRDHLNSLARGLFLHPQSQQQNISDNSSKSQVPLTITRKGSLLLRTHLIQNYFPISRSVPFITQRPLCHVITEIWTWTSWKCYYSTCHSTLTSIIFLRFIHVLVCVSGLSFQLLSSIPVYEHITVCMSSPLLMSTWVVTSAGLLWIKIHSYVLLFLLGKYTGQSLDHRVWWFGCLLVIHISSLMRCVF